MRFNLLGKTVTVSMGNSWWGGEPEPLKASWRFEIEVDYNNRDKLKVNYDMTNVFKPEHEGMWVALNKLRTEVVDYDQELSALLRRTPEGECLSIMKYSTQPRY